jgi:ubiquinone/menaquinone biosynthesis C-methylase UbiE
MDPQRIAALFGIREGMRIADFGCGSGYFTIYVAKLTGKNGLVTAVDVLETALDTVRAKAKNESLNNINFVRSNLEVTGSSGLASDSQDIVLLANILFETDKKEEIIKESARVLKNGGGLIVIDWKKGTNGFGPPDTSRMDQISLTEMVGGMGFKYVNEIDAGIFHFGVIFRKI